MKRMLPLLFLLITPALVAQPGDWTTVFVVRHAEKQDGEDPGLTGEGQQRASRLAALLANAGVDALFSSEYRRTRDTLAPAAEATGLAVEVMPAREPQTLVDRILGQHRGQQVLIASHSNLVPELVKRLGGAEPGPIAESEYFHLFVVTIAPDGKATTVELKY